MYRLVKGLIYATTMLLVSCGIPYTENNICGNEIPELNNNCGICEVLRCIDNVLVCATPETPRQDIRLIPPPGLSTVELSRLNVDISSSLQDDLSQTLNFDGHSFLGCLPGLNTSTTVQGRANFYLGNTMVAQSDFGPVSIDTSQLMPIYLNNAQTLLPDDDKDGAANLYEVLSQQTSFVSSSTQAPGGFYDRFIDWIPMDDATLVEYIFETSSSEVHVIGIQLSSDRSLAQKMFVLNTNLHTFQPPVDIPEPCEFIGDAYLLSAEIFILCINQSEPHFLHTFRIGNGVGVYINQPELLRSTQLPSSFGGLGIAGMDSKGNIVIAGYNEEGNSSILLMPSVNNIKTYTLPNTSFILKAVATDDRLILAEANRLWSVLIHDLLDPDLKLTNSSSIAFSSEIDNILVTGDDIWISFSDQTYLEVVGHKQGQFDNIERVSLPSHIKSVNQISSDGSNGHWIYATDNTKVLRLDRAFRRVDGLITIDDASGNLEILKSIISGPNNIYVTSPNLISLIKLGTPSNTNVLDSSNYRFETPLSVDKNATKIIGFAMAKERQELSSGILDDYVEDTYVLSERESKILVLWQGFLGWPLLTLFSPDNIPIQANIKIGPSIYNSSYSILGLNESLFPVTIGVSIFDFESTDIYSGYSLSLYDIPTRSLLDVDNSHIPENAPWIDGNVVITGQIKANDPTEIAVSLAGIPEGLEDLYAFGASIGGAGWAILLQVDYETATSNLQLVILDEQFNVVDFSAQPFGDQFLIVLSDIEKYYIGVSIPDGIADIQANYNIFVVEFEPGVVP